MLKTMKKTHYITYDCSKNTNIYNENEKFLAKKIPRKFQHMAKKIPRKFQKSKFSWNFLGKKIIVFIVNIDVLALFCHFVIKYSIIKTNMKKQTIIHYFVHNCYKTSVFTMKTRIFLPRKFQEKTHN